MTRGGYAVLRLAASIGCATAWVGCTTPYRIDAGRAPDTGRMDGGPYDAPVPLDGGPDSPDSPDAPICAATCIDAMHLSPCAGAATIVCELGCLEAPTAHCGAMEIANVEDALAPTPPNGAVVAANGIIDTDGCTWPGMGAPTGQIVSVGAIELCLFHVVSLSIPLGVVLRASGPRALVLVAEGEVQIMGELSVDSLRSTTASPEVLGAGSGSGGAMGMDGTSGGTYAGGGGGGGFATVGGDGGNALSGIGRGGEGGLGAAYLLEPLVGGARGGAGGTTSPSGAIGGPGGGALQVSSRLRIMLSGYLGASGGGGSRGGGSAGGGAGGGSGGAILLEAPEIALLGDLNVSGGGGGSGSCLTGTGTGGTDGAGQTSAPAGGTGCALGGNAGGRGAGSGTPDGTNGGNGSGGGGGAGVVRLRVHVPLTLPGGANLNPRFHPSIYASVPLAVR